MNRLWKCSSRVIRYCLGILGLHYGALRRIHGRKIKRRRSFLFIQCIHALFILFFASCTTSFDTLFLLWILLGRWQDDLAVCWRIYPLGSFSWRQYLLQVSALPRETIEGWPLPAHCWNWGEWGLKEYKWLVHYACRIDSTIDFCSTLAALVGPVQNIFSSPYTQFFIAQQAGQAVVLGRLSLSMCLWLYQIRIFIVSNWYKNPYLRKLDDIWT